MIERLEGRLLLAGDFASVKPLPFLLEWTADSGGMRDAAGKGTGLQFVQTNKLNNEYVPSLIHVDTTAGVLKLTTNGTSTRGSNYELDNTLVNGLGTQFNASSAPFSITARLKGPLTNLSAPPDQAGLSFGPEQDNYVKLVATAGPNGPSIQFIDEQGGTVHAIAPANSYTRLSTFNIGSLDLRINGNPSTGRVSGYYRINDGSWVKIANEVALTGTLKTAFFASNGRATLLAIDKNDAGQFTASFDRLEITTTGTSTSPPPASGAAHPTVTAIRPGNGATGVSRAAFVALDVHLPNAGQGVDPSTLNSSTVRLVRTLDGAAVPAHLNTSGGGDAIVLQPVGLLDANTQYTFSLAAGVTDTSGASFVPFSASFTTGTGGSNTDPSIAFEKIAQPSTSGQQFTGVTIGPDNKLYATTFDGKILRFTIGADGNLGAAQTFGIIQRKEGGPRTITGLVFDPHSTADNLIAFVTHGQFAFENATDWTGKVTRLSEDPNTHAELAVATDYVVGLPRSVRDHMTNQPVFGPDGLLYFAQGSNTSMGAADPIWGMRPEHLLNAAVLQLNTAAVASRIAAGQGPLNVKTEAGGTYNPFAAGAPLKIYADGVRNAYDLVWHSNGSLYVPTNGSAAGGNTPAWPNGVTGRRLDGATYTGPSVPGLTNVSQTQDDYLFRVSRNGYYGHPNPTRGNYVLNGGNPTSSTDANQVPSYPVGTQPDRNYRGAAYNFGRNYSPDGAIEYKGNLFGGKLNGKLLVTRYSGGDDVLVLTPDANGNITSAQSGIAGLTGFADPLDITEDKRNGYLYIAEFGGQQITLARPIAPGASVTVSTGPVVTSTPRVMVSDVVGGSVGRPRTLTIRNNGTTTLALPADAFTLFGPDASQFVLNKPALPRTIPAGQSLDVTVALAATSMSPVFKTATLRIKSNDPSRPTIDIPVRGLAQQGLGGGNEPSLQRLVDFYQIPIKVGDPTPNDTYFPQPPATPNDSINAPKFVKAGLGAVTIEPIALMGVSSNPAVRFGYYEPGSPANKTPLFNVDTPDAQTVAPPVRGSTSFDPGGGEFSFYSTWPGFSERVAYGEDQLNTWEPNANNRRKLRIYPLKNSNGTVVPNAYVGAFEEFAGTVAAAYDQNDMVFIVRNVKPATGAEIGLENLDGAPYTNRLVFNRIQNPNTSKPNVVHDVATIRVRNTGTSNLSLTSLSVTGPWRIEVAPTLPASLAPGRTADIRLRFIATSGGKYDGILKIGSNDSSEPTVQVQLAGYWQVVSEGNAQGSQEPSLATALQVLGYTTTLTNAGQSLKTGGRSGAVGEEVLSAFWTRADSTLPVTVRQLQAFHTQGNPAVFKYYTKGTTTQTTLFTSVGVDSQSFLPRGFVPGQSPPPAGSTTGSPAAGSFKPTQPFGIRVDAEWSEDARNVQEHTGGGFGHHLRFYPVRDRSGNIVANQFLLVMDYAGINYDYNDNVYLISNVRPDNRPSAPFGLTAVGYSTGIALDWAPNVDAVSGYNVYRSTSAGGTFAKLNGTLLGASAYTDKTAASGTLYYYRVTAVNSAGTQSVAASVTSMKTNAIMPGAGGSVTPTPQPPPPTPNPGELYAGVEIGRPTPGGSTKTVTSNKAYDVTGGGFDIDGTADHFRYVYRQLAGNFDKKVRVASLSNVDPWTKAGLMVRESLAASSRNAFIFATPGTVNGTRFSYREPNTSQTHVLGHGATSYPNTWLRMVRSGNVLTGYSSTNGTTWTEIGAFTLSGLQNTLYFGMAVSSHSTTKTATAQFRDLT